MSNIKTSAFGVAKYPHLNTPDTQFNSEGIYQVKLIVPAAEAQEDIKKTDQFKRAPKPYQILDDGNVQFHFKTKFKPTIVDHKKNPLPADKTIWSESILRVNYKPVGYYVAGTGLGCTLRMMGVQVKKLVEGSMGTQGFTEVEPVVEDIA